VSTLDFSLSTLAQLQLVNGAGDFLLFSEPHPEAEFKTSDLKVLISAVHSMYTSEDGIKKKSSSVQA
jgi:hypothetical protein